jgi:hypothetical protein
MGKSVSDNWLFGAHAVPDTPWWPHTDRKQLNDMLDRYPTIHSRAELIRLVESRNAPWRGVYNTFLNQSDIALTPNGKGFPEEWPPYEDVIAPRTIRYANIGDIVFRRIPSVRLDSETPIVSDQAGRYRLIPLPAKMSITQPGELVELHMTYEGPRRSLEFTCYGRKLQSSAITEGALTTERFEVRSPKDARLTIGGDSPLKVRNLSAVTIFTAR